MGLASYRSQSSVAFTLVELLVVIAIIGLLMAILIPTLRIAREQAGRAICAMRMDQQYLGITSFAEDHHNQLVDLVPSQFAKFPCDITADSAKLFQNYGYDRDIFYCPSNPMQRRYQKEMWEYAEEDFVHCGYWYVIGSEERNKQVRLRGRDHKKWLESLLDKNPSTSELIVDQTFSSEFSSSKRTVFHVELGAASVPDQTNHMGQQYRPYGGNACFLDGHIEWRTFEELLPRVEISTHHHYWW